jgi:hypothetical protein
MSSIILVYFTLQFDGSILTTRAIPTNETNTGVIVRKVSNEARWVVMDIHGSPTSDSNWFRLDSIAGWRLIEFPSKACISILPFACQSTYELKVLSIDPRLTEFEVVDDPTDILFGYHTSSS